MFFPDGFVPLTSIQAVCADLAWDRFSDDSSEDLLYPFSDPRIQLYTELLFTRFLDAHENRLWVFQYPNITLRASKQLLWQSKTYSGPCPDSVDAAQEALDHLNSGPRVFLTKAFRITADIPHEYAAAWDLTEDVLAAKQLEGALVCWRPEEWPPDLAGAVRKFLDTAYWRDKSHLGEPFLTDSARGGLRTALNDFLAVCPDGKEASGLTWEEIQAKSGWSRRQIVRALKTLRP